MMNNSNDEMQGKKEVKEKMTVEPGDKLWIAMDTEQEVGVRAIIGTAKSKGEILQKVGTYALSGGKTTYLELDILICTRELSMKQRITFQKENRE